MAGWGRESFLVSAPTTGDVQKTREIFLHLADSLNVVAEDRPVAFSAEAPVFSSLPETLSPFPASRHDRLNCLSSRGEEQKS